MNHERLFKTVMIDLTSSLTKLEDDLERLINTDLPLGEKSTKITEILDKMVSIEASMTKFKSMLIENKENTNA